MLELIPVIEIGYNNQGVEVPNKYPYWAYSALWDKYHSDCHTQAGFVNSFNPYLAGSSFYRLSEITDINLTKLIIDHTKDLRERKFEREQANAFFGGYVLRIDGQDKYYPQCCGDLSDIKYWENLVNKKECGFYSGHPEPKVKIKEKIITFDFTVDEFGECFSPTPEENIIQFDILSLKKAIEIVKRELSLFEQKINIINKRENLNIENIGGLLIWDNTNYE
ncbi:hypothetical protein JWG40_10265 [Leptospira sp. 201903074]|uniref:hypothetical protein n=1 Tax=Leptospira abararensis TaxID=2810036 RepID=UPI001965A744|nr:hypothetical protein [Leptospira abararensis]MBM9547402.1 hypothetical protein [Leptospira abararensis]